MFKDPAISTTSMFLKYLRAREEPRGSRELN